MQLRIDLAHENGIVMLRVYTTGHYTRADASVFHLSDGEDRIDDDVPGVLSTGARVLRLVSVRCFAQPR